MSPGRRDVSGARVSTSSVSIRRINEGDGAGLMLMPTAGRHVGDPCRPRRHRRSVSEPASVEPNQAQYRHRARHQWRLTSTQCDQHLMCEGRTNGQTLVDLHRARRVHLDQPHRRPQRTRRETPSVAAKTETSRNSTSQHTQCITNWQTAPSSQSLESWTANVDQRPKRARQIQL